MRKFLELLRASPVVGAQYVTLRKHFSHPSFVIYFFSQPTHKTKTVRCSKKGVYFIPWPKLAMIDQSGGSSDTIHTLGIKISTSKSLKLICKLLCPFISSSKNT
jgi:hypothetical protein